MDTSQPHSLIVLPAAARRIEAALEAAGFACYAVGGCVRDALRGVTPTDWDFTTDATTAEMKAAFDAAGIAWRPTGERHGTLTALAGDETFEVTTYRIDGAYGDGRHPDAVAFTRSLDADLARRDFTINAMAWSASSGLVDLFDGRADLAAGVIRTVGYPTARFTEDALRILRALRFAATLNFSIEEATADAMHECKERLGVLSRERVFSEIDRLLLAEGGAHLAAIVQAFSDVVALALAGDASVELDDETLAALAFSPAEKALRWTLLLSAAQGVEDPVTALQDLRAPHDLVREVSTLIALKATPLPADRASLRRLIVACGSAETFERFIALRRALDLSHESKQTRLTAQLDRLQKQARRELAEGLPLSPAALAIGGDDLIERGFAPGPAIGQALRRLTDAVVDLELPNEREALLAALRA